MKYTKASLILMLLSAFSQAQAYTIHGQYANLISCDYEWSNLRMEHGYTGTYSVMGEIWTVYFGNSHCEY